MDMQQGHAAWRISMDKYGNTTWTRSKKQVNAVHQGHTE
jgi:hypothetical protein